MATAVWWPGKRYPSSYVHEVAMPSLVRAVRFPTLSQESIMVTGPSKDTINCLKVIKRSMYGAPSFRSNGGAFCTPGARAPRVTNSDYLRGFTRIPNSSGALTINLEPSQSIPPSCTPAGAKTLDEAIV